MTRRLPQKTESYGGSLCAVLQPKGSRLAEPIWCRKLPFQLRVCTGIQSEHRILICLSRGTFFPCPRRSLRFAAPSTAKANTRISWQESLTAHEGSSSERANSL